MTAGNVLGLLQRNVKRMLAYSSIAHSGYMLVAVLAGPQVRGGGRGEVFLGPFGDGLSAMLFYIVVYGVMNLGAFAVLSLIRVNGRPAEDISDLAGLDKREPLAALGLAICIFSLMGMPPTAGFFAKVYVFSTALSHGGDGGRGLALIVLAVLGVLNSAVAAGYYLRIIAVCYLKEPAAEPAVVRQSNGIKLGLLGCCVAVIVLGLWPDGLLKMARMPFDDLGAAPATPTVHQGETAPRPERSDISQPPTFPPAPGPILAVNSGCVHQVQCAQFSCAKTVFQSLFMCATVQPR
jgi:NADH-quinone oxidoreductase subunit N